MSYANLAEMFFTRARELAARPRYRYRVADGWREVTWQTMAERVRAIAAGRLDLGVAPAALRSPPGPRGPPKGGPQTPANRLATVDSLLKLGSAREGDVDFFYLPLAHSFARLTEYHRIAARTLTAFARSIDNLAEDLAG